MDGIPHSHASHCITEHRHPVTHKLFSGIRRVSELLDAGNLIILILPCLGASSTTVHSTYSCRSLLPSVLSSG